MSAQPTSELNSALYALRDLLSREQKHGVDTVALSPESLDRLAELPAALMKMPAKPQAATTDAPAPAQPKQPIIEQEKPRPANHPEVVADTVVPLDELAPLSPKTPATSPASAPSPTNDLKARGIEILEPEGDTKRDRLNNLFRMAKADERCRALGSLRDQMVFATGNPDAEIMFVGEAPGAEEEKERKPFVGPAGQKLNAIIGAMGLSRDDVYISNIVKFRPMIGDGRFQGPKNRKPTPEEMSASVKFVMAEIDVVQPKAVIALGGTAAEGLLDLSGSVSRMRNQFYELKGLPVMVSYHPSYLLRAESDQDGGRPKKRMVWEDMLLVMEKIGLPISDKQRAYFTT